MIKMKGRNVKKMVLQELEKRKAKLDDTSRELQLKIEQEKEELASSGSHGECPKCGANNWKITTNYEPFSKKAWEHRVLAFTCNKCGFSWSEHIPWI